MKVMNEWRPRLSVVAPNLNEERYIGLFLESLTHQEFKDFEVVIVDGGSLDGSLDVIEAYRDKLQIVLIINPKRNIGYIRNVGAKHARGEILFHTSSDIYLEPTFLRRLVAYYDANLNTFAIGGRTRPFGTSFISKLAYWAFDLLRWVFTLFPYPLKKYRPSGNFLSIRTADFWAIGGFPEVKINEDGLLGQRADEHGEVSGRRAEFRLDFAVGHWVKRFEALGGLKALSFYIYVLGNMFPMLAPLFQAHEKRVGEIFANRKDLDEKDGKG